MFARSRSALTSKPAVAALAGCGAKESASAGATLEGSVESGSVSASESGPCGPACAGTCTASGCLVTLASAQWGAGVIAVDSTSVYWTTNNTVMKVAKSGGTPVTFAGGVDNDSIAVDSTSAY
jgi:hypothetical protein